MPPRSFARATLSSRYFYARRSALLSMPGMLALCQLSTRARHSRCPFLSHPYFPPPPPIPLPSPGHASFSLLLFISAPSGIVTGLRSSFFPSILLSFPLCSRFSYFPVFYFFSKHYFSFVYFVCSSLFLCTAFFVLLLSYLCSTLLSTLQKIVF